MQTRRQEQGEGQCASPAGFRAPGSGVSHAGIQRRWLTFRPLRRMLRGRHHGRRLHTEAQGASPLIAPRETRGVIATSARE